MVCSQCSFYLSLTVEDSCGLAPRGEENDGIQKKVWAVGGMNGCGSRAQALPRPRIDRLKHERWLLILLPVRIDRDRPENGAMSK